MQYALARFGRLAVAAGVVAAALGTTWAIGRLLSNPAHDSYPGAPFERFDAAARRIFVDSERPKDKAGEAAWVARWQENFKFYEEQGALSRATADEQAALKAVRSEKYVRGRELAEKVLRDNPQSVVALNALAQAEMNGESNCPRALNTIRRARHLLEARGQASPRDADAREWYLRGLMVEREILYELAQHEAALRVVELMEQVYEPMPRLKFWHLIKLHRLEEAQQVQNVIEQSGKWPSTAANNKLILAGCKKDRIGAYEVSRQIATSSTGRSPVLWTNFAGTAQSNFCLDEMEQALQKALDCGEPDFAGSPYEDLLLLHLQQGDFLKAAGEFKLLQTQRAGRDPSTLAADRPAVDRMIALFLIALGRAGDAERFARRAYEFPSRNANTTSDPVSGELANTLTLWTTLQARLNELEATDFLAGATLADREAARASIAAECWRLRAAVMKILSDPSRTNPLVPYGVDEVRIESWAQGQLLQMLPIGAGQELLRQARESDQHPGAAAYFAALEAEAALLAGNPQRALHQAQAALDGLPTKQEKLLRARTNAVAAEANRRLGDRAEYLRRMDEVLSEFPAVLRLLNIAVPVRAEDDGDPQARRLAAALADSKLLRAEADGFAVRVARQGAYLVVSLGQAGGGTRLSITAESKDGDDGLVRAGLRRFGEKLLSPWLDLTPVEINGFARVPHRQRF